MSKNPPSNNKAQTGAQSGFFADTLGPRPPGGALLGKNGAQPSQTQAQHVQQYNTEEQKGASRPAQKGSAPPRASAPPPRQPEPEPKKKKGWF